MALIAATAVGLWIGLSMQAEPIDPFGWPHVFPPNFSGGVFQWKTYRELHGFFYQLAVESLPLTFPWTIALFGLRLRQPRPSRRRLVHQPGFAASAVVVLLAMVMFLGGLSSSLERATWGDGVRPTLGMELISFRNQCLTEDRSEIFGAGIASVWALLALGQIARAERGWLDRAGRVIGVYWIILLLLTASGIQPD